MVGGEPPSPEPDDDILFLGRGRECPFWLRDMVEVLVSAVSKRKMDV